MNAVIIAALLSAALLAPLGISLYLHYPTPELVEWRLKDYRFRGWYGCNEDTYNHGVNVTTRRGSMMAWLYVAGRQSIRPYRWLAATVVTPIWNVVRWPVIIAGYAMAAAACFALVSGLPGLAVVLLSF